MVTRQDAAEPWWVARETGRLVGMPVCLFWWAGCAQMIGSTWLQNTVMQSAAVCITAVPIPISIHLAELYCLDLRSQSNGGVPACLAWRAGRRGGCSNPPHHSDTRLAV